MSRAESENEHCDQDCDGGRDYQNFPPGRRDFVARTIVPNERDRAAKPIRALRRVAVVPAITDQVQVPRIAAPSNPGVPRRLILCAILVHRIDAPEEVVENIITNMPGIQRREDDQWACRIAITYGSANATGSIRVRPAAKLIRPRVPGKLPQI